MGPSSSAVPKRLRRQTTDKETDKLVLVFKSITLWTYLLLCPSLWLLHGLYPVNGGGQSHVYVVVCAAWLSLGIICFVNLPLLLVWTGVVITLL